MKNILFILGCLISIGASSSHAEYILTPPQPELVGQNFLRVPGIEKMTLDFAIAWTDSVAGLFVRPFDAVVLHVPEKKYVTIDIFNVLGQKVSRLVNEEKLPGEYSIVFNAKDLSSGTYFYRMNAGSFWKTKMVVLVK